MEIWTTWLDVIREMLQFLSSDIGLGAGLAIVVLTLLLRTILLPVSWSGTYRGCVHQKKVMKLQPELQRIKEEFKDQPQLLAERTMSTYRKAGVPMLDGRPILSALAQMPVFIGMFHVLRTGLEGARFLWIASLSRPDTLIALVAGLTTALMVVANPELPEHLRTVMILLPSIFAVIFALKFSSALGLYWVVSNCFSAAQTAAVHRVVRHRIRTGALAI